MFKTVEKIRIAIFDKIVGQMAVSPDQRAVFEYDAYWLKNGFSISPFYLPLKPDVFIAKQSPFNGLFGVFNDSLPDGWGNLLIDRLLLKHGTNPQSLSVIDRLSIVGKSGMGALCYEPDNSFKTVSDKTELNFFAVEIVKIIKEQESDFLELLVDKNGSSGGARPKVLISIDKEDWIVKFPLSFDPSDIGEIEYHYSLIAKKCGVEMPETRLFENKYFGVKRFDKHQNMRFHVHSVAGLLYADYRLPSLDYTELIKAAWALTQNMEEVKKVFRLMVFNVLTGNKDDHAKNFSFIFTNNQWKFAPAYDLTPSYGINDNHSTTIMGQGNPTKTDIMEVSKQAGIKEKTAREIFEEVYENCAEIRVADF